MNEQVWFVPLRLSDAALIRQQSISVLDADSLQAIRDKIRQQMTRCNLGLWRAGFGTDEQMQAIIGLQAIDSDDRSAVLHVFADQTGDPLSVILTEFLNKAFQQMAIYRLEIYLPADSSDLHLIIQQIGFLEEGRQRKSFYHPETRLRSDLIRFSLLRPESGSYATAFIPFKLGVFAVTGNQTGLTYADFVHTGERLADLYQHECAEAAGILDWHGHLQNRAFLADHQGQEGFIVPASAPDPVRRAAEQVKAYFAGELTQFDLPIALEQGSEFQTSVWDILPLIPYGTTWTYEELAFQLSGQDWATARRMARAVGSACGANPLPLILPCHRVIGKDRRLVGFSGGLDVKEFLLDHEIMRCNTGGAL